MWAGPARVSASINHLPLLGTPRSCFLDSVFLRRPRCGRTLPFIHNWEVLGFWACARFNIEPLGVSSVSGASPVEVA